MWYTKGVFPIGNSKMGERIRRIRKERKLTQTQFGAEIGVKGNTVTGYENGTRQPSDSVINNICKTFRVNQTWLRTGESDADESEIFFSGPDTANVDLQRLFSSCNCNKLEMVFLEAYFGLKVDERQAFCKLLETMFPQAVHALAGDSPLDTVWQEATALSESGESGDEEDYANIAREQRLSEKKQAAQASSAKESGVG